MIAVCYKKLIQLTQIVVISYFWKDDPSWILEMRVLMSLNTFSDSQCWRLQQSVYHRKLYWVLLCYDFLKCFLVLKLQILFPFQYVGWSWINFPCTWLQVKENNCYTQEGTCMFLLALVFLWSYLCLYVYLNHIEKVIVLYVIY